MRVGSSRVELLAPLGAETPVGRFLASRGPGMHHVAYEVDDVRAALDSLAGAGAELIDAEPRKGSSGSRSPSFIPTPSTASSPRWCPLSSSEPDSVRVDLAFDGGPILSALVTVKGADELERALATEAGGTVMLDSTDGRYTVVARPRRLHEALRARVARRFGI